MVLIHILMILTMSGGDFDPAAIPPDKRIAYVNKLANRFTGINAAKEYAKAQDDYTPLWELCMDIPGDEAREACMSADEYAFGLPSAAQWSDERAATIRRWLNANKRTLDTLKVATRRKRCFRPANSEDGRLYAGIITTLGPSLMQLGTLMRIKAVHHAMRGEWDQAYKWNSRVHVAADHLYQEPFMIGELAAAAVERRACQQLLALLHRHPPRDVAGLLKAINAGDNRRTPRNTIGKCETLWVWDYAEAWHEWARDPDKHPDLTEQADTWLGPNDLTDIENSIFGSSPFESTEALREALRASSVEQDWKVSLRADEVDTRWHAKPFHVAWKESAEFEREYCEVVLAAPSLAFFGCGKLNSSQFRMLREETAMLRTAVTCAVAIHQYRDKKGRLPKRLEDLVPEFIETAPIDPYSGRPFVYRAKADDFILYSVGSDQDDDGGKHTNEFREPGDRVFWPPPVSAPEG